MGRRGSTFRVELAIAAEARLRSAPRPWFRQGESPNRRCVLVVEDHADTLRAECEILGELSFEVVGVGSVADALAAARARSFDLVLSDLGLPDGTGLELMCQLHDRHGLTGIAVTGYGMEEDLSRTREAGFLEHVVKPITLQRLASAIERVLVAKGEAGTPV
jgi:CheY-like chemotaxis protein